MAWLRFELARRIRWGPWPVALVLYAAFVGLACARGMPGPVEEAGLALLAWTLHAGFGVDRDLGFDDLMTSGLVTPDAYVAGKTAALGIALLAAAAVVAATVWAGSGSPAVAGRQAALFVLLGFWFLPLVLLVEAGVETRLPFVGAFVLFVALGGVAAWALGPERALWLAGMPWRPDRLESLAPLAVRAVGVAPALSLAGLALVRRRARFPAGPGR